MKKALPFFLLFTLFCGTGFAGQGQKPLKVIQLTYSFGPNYYGENGTLTFFGKNFFASTTAGTNAGWASIQPFAPGEALLPETYIFPGECCFGYFSLNGTNYLWDSVDSHVQTNIGLLSGESFAFPASPVTTGRWTIRVRASLTAGDGDVPITISYWALPGEPIGTSQLKVHPGNLTLTFSYSPPDEYFPKGFYYFSEGTFVSEKITGDDK